PAEVAATAEDQPMASDIDAELSALMGDTPAEATEDTGLDAELAALLGDLADEPPAEETAPPPAESPAEDEPAAAASSASGSGQDLAAEISRVQQASGYPAKGGSPP